MLIDCLGSHPTSGTLPRIMEEDVITPPRGGRPTLEIQGLPPRGGGNEPQGSPHGVRAVPTIFTESRSRDSGLYRQKDIGSPVDILVDTVARMQQVLSRLREENRLLRTPAIPQVVQAPGGWRSRRRKCHGLTEQQVWNHIDRCSTLLYGQMAGTMIQQHCNCSLIWRGTR